ncbi:hypothetical protein OIO90_004418 [Microbotryomycetes sp. JL221]|nr:hypothetical protein OIO90_004418 [Microbotryomycetes sp. JL221]
MSSAADAAATSTIGRHWATQLFNAVDSLKQHGHPIRLEELAIRSGVEALLSNPNLLESFQNHERVLVDDRLGLYSYKPDYVLKSKADLVSLLRVHSTRGGFAVKTLRESWPQVNTAIEELEREGKLFVMRTGGSGEREGQMKAVYLNEVRDQYLIDKAGLNAASAVHKQAPVVVKKKAKGRKAGSNRRMKIVNTHLKGSA